MSNEIHPGPGFRGPICGKKIHAYIGTVFQDISEAEEEGQREEIPLQLDQQVGGQFYADEFPQIACDDIVKADEYGQEHTESRCLPETFGEDIDPLREFEQAGHLIESYHEHAKNCLINSPVPGDPKWVIFTSESLNYNQ